MVFYSKKLVKTVVTLFNLENTSLIFLVIFPKTGSNKNFAVKCCLFILNSCNTSYTFKKIDEKNCIAYIMIDFRK